MRKIINKTKLALAFFVIITLFILNLSEGSNLIHAQSKRIAFEQTATVEAKQIDSRALILQNYLAGKGSPMQNNAQDFIDAADKYGVDWKLVPSIAGVESTWGQAIPFGSFNAYGWGVYGNNVIYFKSWKDGIYTLNQGLAEKYISKGVSNPYQINTTYAASPTWGAHVSALITDLDLYAKKYNTKLQNGELANVLSITKAPANPRPNPTPLPTILALR